MTAWNVYLENEYGDDECIDTVFFDDTCDCDYVLDSLINHDGYDSRIEVVREHPMEYEDWLARNEEELLIYAAESGLDRELEFDSEMYCIRAYEAYCEDAEQRKRYKQ